MRERTPHGPAAGRDDGMDDPFRPYDPRAGGPLGASADSHRAARARHGLAIFHDGNAGHFWRGEVASQAGDAVLSVGILLWVAYLTASPLAVALTVALLGLPWLLAGPLAAPFQGLAEPGPLLRGVGYLRALLAAALIPMHYVTIYPVVFALIFAISLCGRLRQGLRAAAAATCLAPGEPELVANDLHVGASLVSVVGPLLATLLFLLLGERILLVAIAAALLYLIAANSDGFLDALPERRRAFARVTLEGAVPDERLRAELLEAARPDEPRPAALGGAMAEEDLIRERALPEWYQLRPRSLFRGIGELRAGLGLAALAGSSRTSLYAQGLLALVGGGLAVLGVFYVLYLLGLPVFYVGVLLAVQSGGAVVGAYWGGALVARGAWRAAIVLGMLGVGAGLVVFAAVPNLLAVLGASLLIGVANGLAAAGAQRGVRIGYDGPERRALAAAEGFVGALCGVAGAFIFVFFYLFLSPSYLRIDPLVANPIVARLNVSPLYQGWGLGELFVGTGALLVLAALLFGASLLAGSVGPRRLRLGVPGAPGMSGTGRMSAAIPATGVGLASGGWDDESGYVPRYGAGAPGASRAGGYGGYGRDTGYAAGYGDTGYGDTGYGGADEDDDDW